MHRIHFKSKNKNKNEQQAGMISFIFVVDLLAVYDLFQKIQVLNLKCWDGSMLSLANIHKTLEIQNLGCSTVFKPPGWDMFYS